MTSSTDMGLPVDYENKKHESLIEQWFSECDRIHSGRIGGMMEAGSALTEKVDSCAAMGGCGLDRRADTAGGHEPEGCGGSRARSGWEWSGWRAVRVEAKISRFFFFLLSRPFFGVHKMSRELEICVL